MKKYRRGIFIVVYSNKSKPEYLLLKRKLHWKGWEFPKGGRKRFELIKNTLRREIEEETGLKIVKGSTKNHHLKGIFLYEHKLKTRPGYIGQKYSLYSVEVNTPGGTRKKKIDLKKNPAKEHSDYGWFDFKRALKKLTWSNQRKCLRVVNKYLLKSI